MVVLVTTVEITTVDAIAACMAAIASFVASPTSSPAAIFAILAFLLLSSCVSKTCFSRSAVCASAMIQ